MGSATGLVLALIGFAGSVVPPILRMFGYHEAATRADKKLDALKGRDQIDDEMASETDDGLRRTLGRFVRRGPDKDGGGG